MPFTAAAPARSDPPGLRALERVVMDAADGLKPSLVFQLKQIARDLKHLGATDRHIRHAMTALIEEIRVSMP